MGIEAVLLGLWLAMGAAWAQVDPVAVAVPDGALIPGAVNTFEVGVAGAVDAPEVSSAAGPVRRIRQVATGVWEYSLAVPAAAESVTLSVDVDGRPWIRPLDVWVPMPSKLVLPRRIDGIASGEPVVFEILGDDLPAPEDLQVVVPEGRVTAVQPTAGGLRVTFEPDDSPFPRYVPIGVRDARRRDRPTWGAVRLRARPSLPLESEPGSVLTLYVGERSYGPMVVGPDGRAQVRIDQYPDEIVATAVFVDDLGNESRTEIPLARPTQPVLAMFPSGDLIPGDPAPVVYLSAVQSNGLPWRGKAPRCSTAAADVELRELARGEWLLTLPRPRVTDIEDFRIDCALGDEPTARLRVPVARGIPARLGLRVWPSDLRSDFPFAELRVVLEDHHGDRMDVGDVKVWAEHGAIVETGARRSEVQAEYDGSAAVLYQGDRVHASYTAAPSAAVPTTVQLGWESVPRSGQVALTARVLDSVRRPVPGVAVALDAGADSAEVTTDDRGMAQALVGVVAGAMPVVLTATTALQRSQGVGLRGRAGRVVLAEDLSAVSELVVRPGRVAGLSVRVDPAVLRAAPGAIAWVYVEVEDHAGNPIGDEAVRMSATEGTISPLRARADGTLVAEYTPATSDRPHDVEITAEVDSVRSTARLSVAPRLVRFTLGAWGGLQTNFGSVVAPVVGVDADLRVRSRLAGESLMLRFGVARYAFSSRVPTGSGPDAELSAAVYPVTLAALLRKDQGVFGVWAGGGAAVGLEALDVRFAGESVGRGVRIVGGPTAVGGAGVRALGGEALVMIQATWLPVDAGVVGFSGNIGGLATGLGYRLVF